MLTIAVFTRADCAERALMVQMRIVVIVVRVRCLARRPDASKNPMRAISVEKRVGERGDRLVIILCGEHLQKRGVAQV